jgi:hypothetical protein
MTGIRVDHDVPSIVSKGPYTILELAKGGLMHVNGWEYVEANVEPFEHPDGTKRIRLKRHG